MLRVIAAVILGYIVMAVFVMATFSLAYVAMGADGAFHPGSYEVSTPWLAISIALGAVAALLGGLVCVRVGRGMRAPQVLAGLVLVLGMLLALLALRASPAAGPRAGAVSNMEAMQKAKQPTWISLLNPLIGAAGVMAGASLRAGAGRTGVP